MSGLFSRILHVILPPILLAHTIFFLVFWLTNRLFYTDTNDYLTKMLGASRDYISTCLFITTIICLWSIALLITEKIQLKYPLGSLVYGLYALIAFVYLVFFYGSFWLLFRESPVQLPRMLQMMLYFRWVLDIVLFVGISLLAGLWTRSYLMRLKAHEQPITMLPVMLVLASLIILWAIPLVVPPDSVYRGALPKKPLLIAHRGAAMLAPENTLAAIALAAMQGVYGLETDIRISADGIPFLMHDNTLGRTTNLKEVYPDRLKDNPEYFTIAEVTQLYTGKWFVERDPFGMIATGRVSPGQIEEYKSQKVPTLAEALAILRQNDLAFIFDLETPPSDHPFAESFFEICLKQIHETGIDNRVWVLVDPDHIELLRAIAPEMKLAYGVDYRHPPSVEDLTATGYQMINSEYGLSKDLIHKYQKAGIWVNLWTVDEPWQYSRLWLLGVDSTTTNNAQGLLALTNPVGSISYGKYLALWASLGIFGLLLVLRLTLPILR